MNTNRVSKHTPFGFSLLVLWGFVASSNPASAQSLTQDGIDILNTVVGGTFGGLAGYAVGSGIANQMSEGPTYRPEGPVYAFAISGTLVGAIAGRSDGRFNRWAALGGFAGGTLGLMADMIATSSTRRCCTFTPLGFGVGTSIGFVFAALTEPVVNLNTPDSGTFLLLPPVKF